MYKPTYKHDIRSHIVLLVKPVVFNTVLLPSVCMGCTDGVAAAGIEWGNNLAYTAKAAATVFDVCADFDLAVEAGMC